LFLYLIPNPFTLALCTRLRPQQGRFLRVGAGAPPFNRPRHQPEELPKLYNSIQAFTADTDKHFIPTAYFTAFEDFATSGVTISPCPRERPHRRGAKSICSRLRIEAEWIIGCHP
jgi:hypothetical protein